jgi:hypothetical protein
MDRNSDTEEVAAPVQSDMRAKLKIAAHYAMLGFAPVVSVVALVIAVVAVSGNSSKSDRAQLSEYAARIESLNASLSETRNELENHKLAMVREKSQHADERKKADEYDAKVVQNISRLQAKMKVSPTLEEQLREAEKVPASAPVVGNAASAPVTAPAATVAEKKPPIPEPVIKQSEKTAPQVKALKEAIQKFNRQ